VGTFRNPVGPLPSSVYWRRRIVLLGIPLFVIALVAYACTGTSGAPQNTAAPGAGNTAGSSPTGVITPGASQTASGPPGHSYPTSPTSSNSAGTGTGSGGTSSASAGSTGSTAGAGTTHQAASGAAAGCALTLTIALDQTSSSGTVRYAAGTYPTFKITATDSGSANCTVDVSGKGLVVSVMPLGTTKPIWTSEVCSGAGDLRVLGPGDAQTYPVVWKRWESQGTTCPVSKLPTVPQGTYTVNAETGGVTTSAVEFILN
jgi:hypothetical protein